MRRRSENISEERGGQIVERELIDGIVESFEKKWPASEYDYEEMRK